MTDRIIFEAYTKVLESAKIEGVALIPTISRNHNLYTKQELARFDGVTVPLNWEHDPSRVIGKATFHYNPETETVFYEGEITDGSASMLAKNKVLYTSIEATPVSVKELCNGPNDCFHMPFGLKPEGLALTETPGVLQTSVKVIENYIEECNDPSKHRTFKRDKEGNLVEEDCVSQKVSKLSDEHPDWSQDKKVAVAMDMCNTQNESMDSVDNILQTKFSDMAKSIEEQIKYKQEALELMQKVAEENPDPVIQDQIAILENDIGFLTNQLIQIRKDSEYVSVESLDKIVDNMKEKWLCECCGDVKKKNK